jgi:transcriptional regulator with XRE-family HTH domain
MLSVDEISKIVGGNIKNARLMRNYSQDYLAICLHISQNAYSKIELGKSHVSVQRALEITRILAVPFEDLIAGTRHKNANDAPARSKFRDA